MKVLKLIGGICLVLFFVGGPSSYAPRSYQHAWGLGHILFFSILSYLLLKSWQRISKKPYFKQCVWVFLVVLLFGIAIELAQLAIHGSTPSVGDLIRNFIGCLLSFAFFLPSRRNIRIISLRILQFSVLLMLVLEMSPFAKSLIDEAIARKQFPVLSAFETPYELERWSGGTKISIDHETARHGKS
ncbi:MAG: VanZ family protein, partial [Desulfatiglandales bacterium]